MGVHYVSDVAAGAMLGTLMGILCYALSGWLLASANGLLTIFL
jgi:membrane-associated phospholipid phosphatase